MSDSSDEEERVYGATPPPGSPGSPVAGPREERRLWDRPLSSLTVGEVAKGYAVYVAVGLVVGLIGIAALASRWPGEAGPDYPRADEAVSLDPGDAPEISTADFRSLKLGTTKAAVERKVGKGERQEGGNPFGQTVGGTMQESCFLYPLAGAAPDGLALLCYADGRLSTRERI